MQFNIELFPELYPRDPILNHSIKSIRMDINFVMSRDKIGHMLQNIKGQEFYMKISNYFIFVSSKTKYLCKLMSLKLIFDFLLHLHASLVLKEVHLFL